MRKILLLTLVLLLSFACAAEEAVPELLTPVGVNPDLAVVTLGTLDSLKVLDGFVAPETEELNFTQDGTVKKNYVFPGDEVKQGDLLAELDLDDLDEYIESLEQQLERLIENDRYYDEQDALELEIKSLEASLAGDETAKRLAENAYAETELSLRQADELRAFDIETLRSTIETEKAKTEGRYLYAPFDGTITYISPDKSVVQSSAYMVIADDTRLYVYSTFLSTITAKASHDLYALINGGTYHLDPIPKDQAEYIREVFAGGTIYSQYNFIDAPEGVQSGDYAAVIYIPVHLEDVLIVPKNAVITGSTGKYVYQYIDGQRVRTSVATGSTNGVDIVITDGLKEGDLVYVSN